MSKRGLFRRAAVFVRKAYAGAKLGVSAPQQLPTWRLNKLRTAEAKARSDFWKLWQEHEAELSRLADLDSFGASGTAKHAGIQSLADLVVDWPDARDSEQVGLLLSAGESVCFEPPTQRPVATVAKTNETIHARAYDDSRH